MAITTMRTAAVISGLAVLALAGAGCSSEKSVDKNDVAKTITSKLNSALGHNPESVTCPDDLKAIVGATLDCQAKEGGISFTVPVKVTSVDGDTAKYDINVVTLEKDKVVSGVSSWAGQQLGHDPESATCPGDLLGVVGVTMDCQVVDAGDTTAVHVKVTSVNGTDIGYDLNT